jgi:multidrug efflux system membrane fusion protein
MFVRVRLPIGQPHPAMLVIDRAIQSDQGLKYVYVLDAQNKVQTRSITTGSLQEDGLRVVEGELKPNDWVVVGAIQQLRPQMDVKPDKRPMPTLGGQSEAAPQAAGRANTARSAGRAGGAGSVGSEQTQALKRPS